jgi:cellulose synthase/poly-beta-1,6-N-acetylglucosamine synthase-like glycosyltransferase
VIAVVVLFWGSLAALAWTHALYPATVALAGRLHRRRIAQDDAYRPRVAVIVTAFNEERSIVQRLENLQQLDYPQELLELVVTSDASTDRTEELAEEAGARVLRNPRGGKVAAQDAAVRATEAEVVAFTDANSTWSLDALRKLVRNLADPSVAYVCGRLRLEAPDGSNKEGVYWRYELVTREGESRLGSVTAGNGAIYALRRADYAEVDPRFGHDLALPYLMVQRGRRAVYEPEALASERPTPTNESEYRRKVRMFEHAWLIVLRGRMLRRQPPGYFLALVSHRHLRYASGVLHLLLFATSLALLGEGEVYAVFLGLQLGLLAAALAGVGIARYYVLITWATVVALWNYLRRGVPPTWAPQREELA